MTFFTYDLRAGSSVVIEPGSQSAYMLYLGIDGSSKILSPEGVTTIKNELVFRPVDCQLTLTSKLGGGGIILVLSAEMVQSRFRKLRKRSDRPAFPVQTVTISGPDSPPAAKLMVDCLSGAADEIRRTATLSHAAGTSELLLMLLSEAIRQKFDTADPDGSEAVPWYVTVVERHLSSALSESVSVTDLARLVGLSPRTLHEGFRRYRGCSPMKFLRDQRMKLIHQELSAPQGITTVTDAAFKWGFNHLGRFSAYYTKQFGEKPSETLREARTRLSGNCPQHKHVSQATSASQSGRLC